MAATHLTDHELGVEVAHLTGGETAWSMLGADALYYCNGAGQLLLHGDSHELTPETVVLVPRGTRSMVQAPAWRLRIRNRALAPNQAVDRHASQMVRQACQWASQHGCILPLPPPTKPQLDLRAAIETFCAARDESVLRRRAAFFIIIAELEAVLPDQASASQHAGAAVYMRQLLEHLAVHYAENWQVAEAQAFTGLSRSHFHAAFRQATGTTFIRYLTRLRIGEAARMLRHNRQAILDIAYSCGFGSPSRFYKAFKAQLGTTPERYRHDCQES